MILEIWDEIFLLHALIELKKLQFQREKNPENIIFFHSVKKVYHTWIDVHINIIS